MKSYFICILSTALLLACKADSSSAANEDKKPEAVAVTHGDEAQSSHATTITGDNKVTGKLIYQGKTIEMTHAYLVSGPSDMDPSSISKHLIFTTKDFSSVINKAGKLSELGSKLMEGLMIEVGNQPRNFYWMVLDGQKVQYSGTLPKESLTLKSSSDKQYTGTLKEDATNAGGPQIDLSFDLEVMKEFK